MDALYLILYVVAAVLFLFAGVLGWGWRAAGNGAAPRFGGWSNLVAFGLLAWVLVPLIMKARSM
jgi:hypothetical protein